MNYDIPLLDQFIGVFILSFIIFIIILGVLYAYFSPKSARIHGIILVFFGGLLVTVLVFIGNILLSKSERVPWWNIFKIEAFFADLGALFGILAALGLLMIVIINTETE
jgi:hypothetical protein